MEKIKDFLKAFNLAKPEKKLRVMEFFFYPNNDKSKATAISLQEELEKHFKASKPITTFLPDVTDEERELIKSNEDFIKYTDSRGVSCLIMQLENVPVNETNLALITNKMEQVAKKYGYTFDGWGG